MFSYLQRTLSALTGAEEESTDNMEHQNGDGQPEAHEEEPVFLSTEDAEAADNYPQQLTRSISALELAEKRKRLR